MPNNPAGGTWEVYVMDLFHAHDSAAHRWVSGFSTREDACDFARDLTWSSVQECREPGMTAEALKQQWRMFGECASVSGEPHYSGADEIDYFVAYEYRLGQPDWVVDSSGVAKAAPAPGDHEWHLSNPSPRDR
jgi:hypothetical protein